MSKRGQNEGSIRQRKDGTWEARYTVGVKKMENLTENLYMLKLEKKLKIN